MNCVLKGRMWFEYGEAGDVLRQAGDSAHRPPRIRHREVSQSDDLELLEITSPAKFPTAPAAG